MTQTGGLVILLAWAIFGGLLAILSYLLLRSAAKDPLEDISTPTVDQPADAAGSRPSAESQPGASRDT